MASKKTKAPAADDNIDDLFSGIADETKTKKPTGKTAAKGPASKAKGDDPLADLESQLAAQDLSRPHTPRLKDPLGGRRSTATPPAPGDVDKAAAARKSTDSARSLKASFTPSATSSELHESEKKGSVEHTQAAAESQQAAGGGWWGGLLSSATATANAAMKQAEAAYKEIQQNEEAKKWAEQVKGINLDVGTLRTYGE